MPIYEYLCLNCDKKFEAQQPIDHPPLTKCPDCEGQVRRVIHPHPIIFKGSGFYSTDKHEEQGEKEVA